MDVSTRPAGPEDSELVFAIRRASFGPYLELSGGWDEAAERAQHVRRFGSQVYEVIERDGEPVGSLSLERGHDALSLFQLFLLPAAQGQGLGAEIMRRLMAEARAAGVPLRLGVRHVNPRALAFYLRLGFERAGEDRDHVRLQWHA